MNWGKIEHNIENKTNTLLVVGVVLAVAFPVLRYWWLPYALATWTIVVAVVHLFARFAHLMEKRHWKKSDWSPRSGKK